MSAGGYPWKGCSCVHHTILEGGAGACAGEKYELELVGKGTRTRTRTDSHSQF